MNRRIKAVAGTHIFGARIRWWLISIFFLIFTMPICLAELFVHPLFASNMVLQRDMPDPVWGWTSAGESVELTFGGKTYAAAPDSAGRWQVLLPAMPANATPQTMVIATKDGANKQTFSNILVGDIWLCAGQSNMAASTSSLADAKQIITEADSAQLRLFRVDVRSAPRPEQNFLKGGFGGMLPEEKVALDATGLRWQQADAKSLADFSGVAVVFGNDLRQSIHVPIGLVEAAFGGTTAQLWIPRDVMLETNELKALVTNFKGYVTYPNYPGGLYNGSIVPLEPMAFKGLVWYQGESNSETYDDVALYGKLLPTLIKSWRDAWGRTFPVLLVQIAAYHEAVSTPTDAPLARLREIQARTARDLPAVGMVTSIDIGLAANWHPDTKSILGHRLAIAAEGQEKNSTAGVIGPQFRTMRQVDGKVIVQFSGVGQGLETREVTTNRGVYVVKADKLQGFSVSGEDGVFHWADAKLLSSNEVELHSIDVAHPINVRYAWDAFPLCNLYSSEGLPATPFRTDTASAPYGK